VPATIATVETLSGHPIEEEAPRMAREAGLEGIFILISKQEKKIQVLVSHQFLGETMKRGRDAIRTAFLEGFRERNFDLGLKLGVTAIGESLMSAQRAGELFAKPLVQSLTVLGDPPSSGVRATSALVLRNQVRLTLSGARVLIAAAQEKATALNLRVNIAVVDDGGHLLAFERMDGARPASGYTAITKATSAATFRQNSGPIPPGAPGPDPLLNLSLQLAASASGGKLTSLLGGVTVLVDGQVIGAIGVGGGTGEQDTQIATAGVAALNERLAGDALLEHVRGTLERAKKLENP
jgi:glc operon protein GlcG